MERFTVFQVSVFVVECLVVIIGLIEIEHRWGLIRKLNNWRQTRTHQKTCKRIEVLQAEAKKIEDKAKLAELIPQRELILIGFNNILVVATFVIAALVLEHPFMLYKLPVRWPFTAFKRFNAFIDTHSLIILQIVSFSCLLLAFGFAFESLVRNTHSSPASLTKRKERVEKEIAVLQEKLGNVQPG